jgi:hypothetical protein
MLKEDRREERRLVILAMLFVLALFTLFGVGIYETEKEWKAKKARWQDLLAQGCTPIEVVVTPLGCDVLSCRGADGTVYLYSRLGCNRRW